MRGDSNRCMRAAKCLLVTCLLPWLVAGCAWLGPQRNSAEAESRRLADRAREAAECGDLAQARELLARAVSANPEDAELHRERARMMLEGGDCQTAVEHLLFAASRSPEDAAVLFELASAYAHQENWPAARRAIESALAGNPRHVPALLLAAQLADRSGDESGALSLYHRVLHEDDRNAAARLGIAAGHLRRNRLPRAAPLLRAVGHDAQACPADRARAFRELGHASARQQRWSEARDAFAALVQFKAEATADDWYALAYAQSQLGELAGAREAVRAALQSSPEHEPALALAASLQVTPPAPLAQAGHTQVSNAEKR